MTTSHWRRSASPEPIVCDALVVGAGVCGVSAALHLERRGLNVRIIDRDRLCSGASGRNAGFLMRGAADNYAAGIRAYGRDTARALWKLTEDNLAGLRAEGIESLPNYQRVPSVLLAISEEEHDQLRESLTLLHEDGLAAGWVDRSSGTDTVWQRNAALGGLVNPNDAACHPVELVAHLASKFAHPVLEHQEALAISPSGRDLTVRTSDFSIHTSHVLICTNAYAQLLLPSFASLVSPRRGQMLAIRPGNRRLDASYYAHHGSEYFRQTLDGTIVVGGCRTYHAHDEVGYEDLTTPAVQSDIERFAAQILGADRDNPLEVIARWSGTMGFSPDGLPLVGPIGGGGGDEADRAGRVWFCGGFTGHGMSMAYRTAQLAIAAMLDGADNPFPIDRHFATAAAH
ncbi:MAG: FAD-binding oxidoreductase [Phycisphaerales bacterium]|nr:FAD-binding oxidoreductase [Phycisphaerales bacterium]